MQRGLVRRYFTMCCSIILTSIILLGVIFMVFAAQYFKEDSDGKGAGCGHLSGKPVG